MGYSYSCPFCSLHYKYNIINMDRQEDNRSLKERLASIKEEACGSCGMSGGADGFEGSAAPEGPTAGFDPLMNVLKKLKKKKKK